MSKKSFLDAVGRKNNTGQLVFGTGTSIVCQELMDQLGVYFPDAHLDPEKMAALAMAGHTVLGFDVVMPLFSVCHEAAAMGCKVNWGGVDIMPLGNLVKGQVRELARSLGIPQPIIDKPPSAGLWEGQTDEEELGLSYEELDRYLVTGEASDEVRRKIESMIATSNHKRQPPLVARL